MLVDETNEVFRCIAGQRGLGKMRIGGKKVLGCGAAVGEVAAPAAGDEDLLADAVGPFQDHYFAAVFARLDGAHQPRGTGSQNDGVECVLHGMSLSGSRRTNVPSTYRVENAGCQEYGEGLGPALH